MGIATATLKKAYTFSLKRINKRLNAGQPIRIGFGVAFESIFPMASVFKFMLKDKMFDPFIFPIPCVNQGKKFEHKQYNQTLTNLAKDFPAACIVNPYNNQNDNYADISDLCDLYCTANPYDPLTLPQYSIEYFWKKHIPVFYSHYGTPISKANENFIKTHPCFGKLWRVYTDNHWIAECFTSNPNHATVLVSGAPKMDSLAFCDKSPRKNKRIIIGLHHSVKEGLCSLNFGTFLEYADFYLSLPYKYPDIDFVFRLHPLLYPVLEREEIWGKDKTEIYWKKINEAPNAIVDKDGDFRSLFANSEALIHDFGSFLSEFLYTGNPCCKVMPTRVNSESEYSTFGKKCLDAHYKANSKEEILRFIEEVVLNENDLVKSNREQWLNDAEINYPHTSDFIIKDIKTNILNS